MENKVFKYNGQNITFQLGNGDVMVNATEMAKPFGKRPIDWLRLPSTTQFIDTLQAVRKSHRSELVNQINGVGTWFHEDVTIEFARWLSPQFAIWTNDRIKELIKHGVTAVNPEQLISDPDFAISILTKLKEERAEKERFRLTSEQQAKELKEAAPKVEYYDEVLSSKGLLTVNMIAANLGMSAVRLNNILCDLNIQYKQSGVYFLYEKYKNRGFTEHKPYPYRDSNGEIKSRQHMYWTETGKQFILNIMSNYQKQAV